MADSVHDVVVPQPPTLDALLVPPFTLLAAVLGATVSAVEATPLAGGGYSGVLTRLRVSLAPGEQPSPRHLVLKTHAAGALRMAAGLGLAREALAYTQLASRLQAAGVRLAHCYFAAGDMASGRKAILLDDVSGEHGDACIDSGLCFGEGSPLNWARAAKIPAALAVATPEVVARSAFLLAARWHAAFWRDAAAVREAPWLRGSQWLRGEGRAGWEAFQAQAASSWAATERGDGPASGVVWDPTLVAVVRASLGKASFADACAALAAGPWTIVHGDFHPGNVLLLPSRMEVVGSPPESLALDLEAVGVGSGPQELGQYAISHMAPELRRGCERRLVREYSDALLEAGVPAADAAFDRCWSEYVAGGAARWVWFLALLSGMCDAASVTYWAAQLGAFIADHGITAESIGQPRV